MARYPLCRRLVGPTTGLELCGKSRSPDRPACSESLYRLRIPGPHDWIGYVVIKQLTLWAYGVNLIGSNYVPYSEAEGDMKSLTGKLAVTPELQVQETWPLAVCTVASDVLCLRNFVCLSFAYTYEEFIRDRSDTASGVPRNFFRGGRGFNKFSWGQRTERTGIWGRSLLVRSSGGSCNLVQEISFHKVKFS